MKRISVDFRKGYAKVKVENADDLWYLSQIIDKGDLISGRTLRKIKVGNNEEKANVIKKPIFIKIRLEKIEFGESQLILRALGTVVDGPEDIPHGEHHSFNIEEGTELNIEKERWLSYQVDKLDESFSSKTENILIVVFDREEAHFALMKKYGYEIIATLKGNVMKKDMDEGKKTNFYVEIIKKIEECDKRYNFATIIIASPSFWKEELLKNLDNDLLKRKLILASSSSSDSSAINEVLKRDEVRKALLNDRTTKEINFVEMLVREIGINGKATYGLKDVENAVSSGAVETLLVGESLIKKLRADEKFSKLEKIMKNADSGDAKIHIISSEHEGGRKLAGLGGIGALLRYKLNY